MKEESNEEFRKRATYDPRAFRAENRVQQRRTPYGRIALVLLALGILAYLLERYR
jgi:hypothetical protein